jgi:hypothetical protein
MKPFDLSNSIMSQLNSLPLTNRSLSQEENHSQKKKIRDNGKEWSASLKSLRDFRARINEYNQR